MLIPLFRVSQLSHIKTERQLNEHGYSSETRMIFILF